MTLTQDIHEEADRLATRLEKAGLVVAPFSRGPLAPELFALNLDRANLLRVWPGLADVDVATSPKHRQAVLTARESKRKITRRYSVWENGTVEPGEGTIFSGFPVFVPGAKRGGWDVGNVVERRYKQQDRDPNRGGEVSVSRWMVEASMRAPASTTSFLMGFDETSQFISQLPRPVESVKEAHNVLKPLRAYHRGTIRQGEWFLVPVTAEERKAIDESLARYPRLNFGRLENGSSHCAATIRVSNRTYATGLIYDLRRTRHAPVKLDGWYRVIRNREKNVQVQPAGRTRYWD